VIFTLIYLLQSYYFKNKHKKLDKILFLLTYPRHHHHPMEFSSIFFFLGIKFKNKDEFKHSKINMNSRFYNKHEFKNFI